MLAHKTPVGILACLPLCFIITGKYEREHALAHLSWARHHVLEAVLNLVGSQASIWGGEVLSGSAVLVRVMGCSDLGFTPGGQ